MLLFDESNRFYPVQAHDKEKVNAESWNSNFLPCRKTPQEKNEGRQHEKSFQDLHKDWKFLHNHPKDQILGNSKDG